jgi:excisionase family DNA binding protein
MGVSVRKLRVLVRVAGRARAREGLAMELQKRLSIAEAAERLGVSPFTLRSWLRQRRLPYHRLGRRIVLDPADVETFLQGCRVEARDRPGSPSHGTRDGSPS